jgi:hypothetical protein
LYCTALLRQSLSGGQAPSSRLVQYKIGQYSARRPNPNKLLSRHIPKHLREKVLFLPTFADHQRIPLSHMPTKPRVILYLALLTLLFHCSDAPASAPEIDVEDLGPNAAIIRNPVDQGSENVDTSNVARMTFEETEFLFGEVKEGEVVNKDFAFVNTGKVPLLITNARSTCGCTVPKYPEMPIAPGDSGVISVAFNTAHKYGRQRKAVTLTANTYPASTILYVDGTVINEKEQ